MPIQTFGSFSSLLSLSSRLRTVLAHWGLFGAPKELDPVLVESQIECFQ